MVVRAVVEVTGCCQRFRAQLVIKPAPDQVMTLEAFGVTAVAAHKSLMKMAGAVKIKGLNPEVLIPRRWPLKEYRPTHLTEQFKALADKEPSMTDESVPAAESATEEEAPSRDNKADDNIKHGGDEDL